MRVLVDTNVLVSALLRDRTPETVILWVLGQEEWEWVVSPSILEEYRNVLQREKFGFPSSLVEKWVDLFEHDLILIEPQVSIEFPRDRKDAKFIECAEAAKADVFITGDEDFEEAQALMGARIFAPAAFADLFLTT